MDKKFKDISTFLIPFAIVLVTGIFLYFGSNMSLQKRLPADDIAQKTLDFINNNVLSQGITASLIDITEEGNVYKIRVEVEGIEYQSYVSKDGRYLFPDGYDLDIEIEETEEPEEKENIYTIGNFSVHDKEICYEDGKPIIYFFGSEACSHCQWEHPVVEKVMANFENQTVFHNNMDSQEDMDIFGQYSAGGIPAVVLGCKYSRVGSGSISGEEQEIKDLTALICKLTDGQPSEVCGPVQDLIDQI